MKLKNKATGEINIIKVDEDYFNIYKDDGDFVCPVTLKELNDGWEEPKEYWYIDTSEGSIVEHSYEQYKTTEKERKEIGNHFKTEEEAEQAVEKLKAYNRLKDYNVKFNLDFVHNRIDFTYSVNSSLIDVLNAEEQIFNNMKIVFGGEE